MPPWCNCAAHLLYMEKAYRFESYRRYKNINSPLAQLRRASLLHGEGCRFESDRGYSKWYYCRVARLGSAKPHTLVRIQLVPQMLCSQFYDLSVKSCHRLNDSPICLSIVYKQSAMRLWYKGITFPW